MDWKTLLAGVAVATGIGGAAGAQEVAVITPYLAQPGTQFYVDGFEARAGELGWTVNVIDTAGDVAAVISRMEDVVTQGVDAIVINVDPAQIGEGANQQTGAGQKRERERDLSHDQRVPHPPPFASDGAFAAAHLERAVDIHARRLQRRGERKE